MFGHHRSKVAPGPRGHFLLGSLLDFRHDPLHFYLHLRREFGDIVRFRWVSWTFHLICHPEDIQHVLQTHEHNYRKGPFFDRLKPMLGLGLLTSEGEAWRRQRRILQPAFHRHRIAGLVGLMTEASRAMLERWRNHAERGQALDMAEEMRCLTLEIAGRVVLGTDLEGEAEAMGRAFAVLLEHIYYRSTHLFTFPASFPTRWNRRYQEALRALDAIVHTMIRQRQHAPTEDTDLLSLLLREGETSGSVSTKEVRDQIMTILFAGHETTANALAWTWYLLAKHPSIVHQLHAELAAVLRGRTPTVEDLPHLHYTRRVIEEALRFYPPVWGIPRSPIAADEIRGYRIPKDSHVIVSPYVTHRHPEFWENPEQFNPERFTPKCSADRPRFAYFPFGGGPRQCLGEHLAMTESLVIIATVAQRYHLCLVPRFQVEPEPAVTLRPCHGILMTLHKR